MNRILFFTDFLTEKFGTVLHRIPFDLGLSCPNRVNGAGGCAFCAADGALARHLSSGMELAKQAEAGRNYVRERYGSDGPYLAYFQAFTNTFAEVSVLRRLYSEALATGEYKAVVIATRPDCLSDECIDYLAELSQQYELWVELGVQTAVDRTLELIRRGHDFACVRDAVTRLHARKIHCAAHVILGLPGETREDHLYTARQIAALPFEAVKLHHLLILKGTAMASMLHEKKVTPLNEYEYAEELCCFLRQLPEGMAVMRISADAPQEEIIAPRWWMKKGQFREMFLELFKKGGEGDSPFEFASKTEDGSYTFYHPVYRQHFHSTAGARSESFVKYIDPCRIRERLENGEELTVLDVGFGMGFNVSALFRTAQAAGCGRLKVISLEFDPAVLKAASMLPEHPDPEIVQALRRSQQYSSGNFSVELLYGDARQILPADTLFDAVFLDGFSPDSNPELWTFEFIGELKKHLNPETGMLATYSSAYPLYGALLSHGFKVYTSEPFGRKRGGTLAALQEQDHVTPLPEKDFLIATHSTAGTPYSDPDLKGTRKEILKRHSETVSERRKQGVPKWYRQ